MQGAALGLTCKDAFQVFSQNETLALQRKVKELEALLAHHRPPIPHACDEIHPNLLNKMVTNMFDKLHPPDLRLAPVAHEDEADDPLSTRSIWSNVNYFCPDMHDNLAQNSLQAVIFNVLKNAFGDMGAAYCERQSHKAITAVQHALLGAYQASGWIIFSVQQMQEKIVWHAIYGHFQEMHSDLYRWEDDEDSF